MSQERTGKKLLCLTPIGRRPKFRPKTQWQDYVEDLSWSRLGIPADHLSVAEDRHAWRLQLELLPLQPPKDKRILKMDGCFLPPNIHICDKLLMNETFIGIVLQQSFGC